MSGRETFDYIRERSYSEADFVRDAVGSLIGFASVLKHGTSNTCGGLRQMLEKASANDASGSFAGACFDIVRDYCELTKKREAFFVPSRPRIMYNRHAVQEIEGQIGEWEKNIERIIKDRVCATVNMSEEGSGVR